MLLDIINHRLRKEVEKESGEWWHTKKK
jgi:hypothetical protein